MNTCAQKRSLQILPEMSWPKALRAGVWGWKSGTIDDQFAPGMWWFKRKNGHSRTALEPLGSLETALMELVWRLGECSVRQLHERSAPQLAYTTIMTTVDRLYKKGLLTRSRVGKAYVYAPRMAGHTYREQVAEHLISMAVQNGRRDNLVLSCFGDTVSETDLQMLDRLDQLVKAKRKALQRSNANAEGSR